MSCALQEAMGLIQKAQVEERRTYFENAGVSEQLPMECHVPPPPILLCRTDRTMVFRPAPFMPMSGQKVCLRGLVVGFVVWIQTPVIIHSQSD